MTSSKRLLLISFVVLSACEDGNAMDTSEDTTETGDSETHGEAQSRAYYDGEPSASLGAMGNDARCSTCHSDDGTRVGFPGDSLQDIAYRTSFKGGDADLLGAVNACVTGWMGGPALTAESPPYQALLSFFQGISDPAVTTPNPLMPEVLADEAAYEASYSGGDAASGAAKYAQFCGGCHDTGLALGSVPAPAKAGLSAYTAGRIAQQVRTSGPPPSGTSDTTDTTPGPMPFFEPEELSATDLADIIAHLKPS